MLHEDLKFARTQILGIKFVLLSQMHMLHKLQTLIAEINSFQEHQNCVV
jgi:hypothetical protein